MGFGSFAGQFPQKSVIFGETICFDLLGTNESSLRQGFPTENA